MKLIRNRAKRRIEKYRARIRHYYLREYNKKIGELNLTHAKEIELLISQHDKVLDYKQRQHEKELLSVRENERRNYLGPIEELKAEIKRLREHITNQKRYYETVKEREYLLDDTIKSVADKFFRGVTKANEAFQLMQFANDEAQKFSHKYVKQDLKLIKEV